MDRLRKLNKLSLKLLAMLLLAAVLGSLAGLTVNGLGTWLVSTVYCREDRRAAREQKVIGAFRDFVRAENVVSTDAAGIGAWNMEHPYVQLTVSANGTMLSSDRWGAELVLAGNGLLLNVRTLNTQFSEYAVNFRDGTYMVQVQEFSENRLYPLVQAAAWLLGGLCFLILMLLYNSGVTTAVTALARQVRQVSRGDLALEIHPTSTDEIGGLAMDVDAMRLSIIDKLQREERAWQANAELITAISHDVRTPLTTLMGYLELLRQQPDLDETQREEYLRLCGAKAEKLKDLTDELFSYFLVFGRPEPEQNPEEFDAATLLAQLLGEAAAELEAGGFCVEVPMLPEEGLIRVDLQHLRRVLDNLFSNIRKYADPAHPVTITAQWEEDSLYICLSNVIRRDTARAESTRIGLQTCEKLLTSMGGSFSQERTEDTFTALAVLPRAKKGENSENNTSLFRQNPVK